MGVRVAAPIARNHPLAAGAAGRCWKHAAGALVLSAAGQACLAQSATPGTAIVLEPVTAEAPRLSATAAAQVRLEALPGGVAAIGQQDMVEQGNVTLGRALRSVPGVVVQQFFGGNDQPRVQIRGSGLQQNPVERGILMLQDGLPLNRADGSYIVGFANPQQAETIEVYRGYTANRLGATVLGGALNFTSPTGSTAPGAQITASGGSFGQVGVNAQAGFARERYDASIQVGIDRRDGYRDYNDSQRVSVGGNVGVVLSDNVRTRVFAGYTKLEFDVAGPLNRAAMDANPRQVSSGPRLIAPGVAVNPGPNVVRDRPEREAEQFRFGTRTTATLGAHLIDGALGYTYTDDTFRFPISSGVRTTKGGDVTAVLRYAWQPDSSAPLPLFETTAQYSIGSATREYFVNRSGASGVQFGDNDLDAQTLSLYAGFNIPFARDFTFSPAIAWSYATRDNDDRYSRPTRPTIAYNPGNPTVLLPNGAVPAVSSSYGRSYDGWTPSVALSYRPAEQQTTFVALSRSFEPPTHDDLFATVNGTPNSSAGRPNPAAPNQPAAVFTTPDLDAQTATTLEAGWRGRHERFSWDAVTYYSWVDNELLNLRDVSGVSLGAVNAGKTRHFGIELGVGARLTGWLSGRLAYTYQDFRFHDDPVVSDNRLAGAPRHIIDAMVQVQPTEAWRVQGMVRWLPEKTPVDNANTLYAPAYTVVDLRTDYRITERLTVFAEVTNVFDETYASSTLVVDQARSDQAVYLPGDGRAFYAGITSRF